MAVLWGLPYSLKLIDKTRRDPAGNHVFSAFNLPRLHFIPFVSLSPSLISPFTLISFGRYNFENRGPSVSVRQNCKYRATGPHSRPDEYAHFFKARFNITLPSTPTTSSQVTYIFTGRYSLSWSTISTPFMEPGGSLSRHRNQPLNTSASPRTPFDFEK